MAENDPLQALFVNCQKVTNCIQTHLSNFIGHHSSSSSSPPANGKLPFSFHQSSNTDPAAYQILLKGKCTNDQTMASRARRSSFWHYYERP
ncbi:hypothetical protein WN943_024271 [Citrus x changshan-huyou]